MLWEPTWPTVMPPRLEVVFRSYRCLAMVGVVGLSERSLSDPSMNASSDVGRGLSVAFKLNRCWEHLEID